MAAVRKHGSGERVLDVVAPYVEPRPHVLRDYAFLADGERAVLVGPDGGMVWCCFPHFDSEALFAALVGGDGWYSVRPVDPYVWGGRYEPRSLIWRNRWVTTGGIIECRDTLAFPGDPERAVLLRQLIGIEGHGRVEIELRPRAGYGRGRLDDVHREAQLWTCRSGDVHLRWSAPGEASHTGRDGGRLGAVLDVHPGQRHDLVLELSTRPLDGPPPEPDACWRGTADAWNRAVPDLSAGHASADSELAFAVLRGLQSEQGGMVAAATASLPERADTGRSYDYRYVWLRDQSIAGQAIATHGPDPLLVGFTEFVTARVLEDGPALRPAYDTRGGMVPAERRLDLAGYPGGTDIVGNHVRDQFQLDVFGDVLLLFATAARHDALDVDGWRAVEVVVDAITQRGDQRDAGIWELDDRRWTQSRLQCAAGLRSVADVVGAGPQVAQWTALADRMVADVAVDGVHHSGRWKRAATDDRVDAALLLPGLRGAFGAEDPRHRATYAAVLAELEQDGYVYRYRPDEQPLGSAEGAFLLCGFTTALVAFQLGDERRALRLFDRNRSACGSPGLFAEEFDVGQRQLRGNLPQAFVHALMFECAMRLGDVNGH